MPTYNLWDLVISSSTPLLELLTTESRHPDLTFTLDGAESHDGIVWFHNYCQPGAQPWLLFGRHAKGYLLRFPGLADFSIATEERAIRCHAQEGVPLDAIRHLLLDQVVPMILGWQGRLVLHGSAVLTGYGAIAFVGEPSRGKSTLASSFAEKGFPSLTDDCLLLKEANRRVAVVPSYPGLRLWPETARALFGQSTSLGEVGHSRKVRLDRRLGLSFCTETVPLRRIYLLASSQETAGIAAAEIRPVRPREAFLELIRYTFLLDVNDRLELRHEFEGLSRVTGLALTYRLAFRRDLALLPAVHRAILENLRHEPGAEDAGMNPSDTNSSEEHYFSNSFVRPYA